MPTIYASAYQRIANGPSWTRTGSKLGKGIASSMLMFRRRHAAARAAKSSSPQLFPPNAAPGNRREQQRDRKQTCARGPANALTRAGADFVHHELLALAHFPVRFEKRRNP